MKDNFHIDIQGYLDGELAEEERSRAETHLRDCPACRERLQKLEAMVRSVRQLPRAIAPPDEIWEGVSARIASLDLAPRPNGIGTPSAASDLAATLDTAQPPHGDRPPSRRATRRRSLLVASAAVASIVLAWIALSVSTGTWAVERLSGTPRVADSEVDSRGSMRTGEWLTTDAGSRARLRAGVIGDVDVEPNTRIQLRETRLNDHRIALESGKIEARIWAPPRLFIVETPSATAIDLGCVYSLSVDSAGHSLLSVKSGYVELERGGRSSVVPAGAMCIARRELGPGTAFAADASPRLRSALERYDFEGSASKDLAVVLEEARAEDALTLWQIFERSSGHDRLKVYDRLTSLVTPPSGVTRKDVLIGDPDALRAWRMHLGLEALTWWGYVWRKLAFWKDQ